MLPTIDFKPRWQHKFQLKPGKWVFVPETETLQVGKAIKKEVSKNWDIPSYYYHLQSGGHVNAIKNHINNKYFIHTDIKGFYDQINLTRVTRNLSLLFEYQKARQLAKASVVKKPDTRPSAYILPFGFPQSPIIASICLRHSALGNYLESLSENNDYMVTVYMDDIIISSSLSKTHMADILETIKTKSIRSKLYLNENKTNGPSEEITVFNIDLIKNDTYITEERLNSFITSINETDSMSRVDGIIGYTKTVNKIQADLLTKSKPDLSMVERTI